MLIPFSPAPGLNSDDTTFSAEGRWADGDNVRFWNGKPQPIGGWVQMADLSGSVSATGRAIHAIDRTSAKHIVFAFATSGAAPKLRIASTTTLDAPTDITPAGLATTATSWSLDSFGNILLAVPKDGTLYEQTGTSQATEVTQAPNQITAMIVTGERQVLALGCNEEVSGTFNGRCIRGSDLEDYTDWTTASDNNAFEHIIEDVGPIVGGTRLGSYVVVWTTTGLHLGQFIGDPGQAYRFDKIDNGCGLAGPKAFAILNQRLYWIGPDALPRTWAIGELPTLMPCPILKDYLDNLTIASATGIPTIAAVVISKFREVRFYYPRGGVENSNYIALNVDTAHWHRGANGRNAIYETPLLLETTYKSSMISIMNGRILRDETGMAGTGNVPYSWYIRSGGVYLQESQRRIMIRSILPDFEDQSGNVSLTLYMRDRPQSSAVTKGPYTLGTATTKKDFRASGKIAEVKISGADSTYARLGKLLFDGVPMGER